MEMEDDNPKSTSSCNTTTTNLSFVACLTTSLAHGSLWPFFVFCYFPVFFLFHPGHPMNCLRKQAKSETVKTNYSLADTVFAKAELKCDGRVCIWLGVSTRRSTRGGSLARHMSRCPGGGRRMRDGAQVIAEMESTGACLTNLNFFSPRTYDLKCW